MKLRSRLCFLVVALSCVSRGQDETTQPHTDPDRTTDSQTNDTTPLPLSQNNTQSEATNRTLPSTSPQNDTSATETVSTTPEYITDDYDYTETGETTENSTADMPGRGEADDVTKSTVSMATASTSPKPVTIEEKSRSSWGHVILVLIVLVIIALCTILYLLRRASRMYSFDLQRPVPVKHLNEPTGTFEAVYLDDLDRPAPKDQVIADDPSPPPVANGTTHQSEEKGSNGDEAPQEQSDANGPETSLPGNTSPTSDPLSSTDLFFDAIVEEQQNGNNNNPSVCSSDPFVEINLEDPMWCD